MAVFGQILYLNSDAAAIVFVGVLICLMLFEGFLHVLEVECRKIGIKALIKRLYREFMIMGFISFAILFASEYSDYSQNKWYEAFHFAHIVLMFVGITFIVQAVVLVYLITFRNQQLLYYDNFSAESLIMEYVQMHNGSGFRRFFFDHGLISMNFPQLRPKIEYKIIQDFFIQSYNLPVEFKFANYMCGVLKDHILALVEIRPIAWLTLATFVALNYIRIAFVDPVYQSEVCERYPSKNHHLSDPEEEEDGSAGNVTSHVALAFMNHFFRPARSDEEYVRRLAGGSSSSEEHLGPSRYHVCEEYTLRYVFVCSAMLMCYIVGLTFASEIYMQRLVDKVLDTELAIQLKEEEQEINRDADKGALSTINEGQIEKEEKGVEEDDNDDSEEDSVMADLTKQNTLNNAAIATPPNNPSTPPATPPNGMIGTVSAVSVTLAATPVSPRVVPKRGTIRKSGSYTSGQTLNLSSISSLNTVNAINALSAVSFDGPAAEDAVPAVVPRRGMLSAKFRAQSYSASLQEKGPSPAVSLLPRLGSNEAMSPHEKRRFSLTRQNSVASSRASFGSMEGGVGLRGLIFGENRRYLYLHCLERIMQKDFNMRQREGELHREPSVRHDYRLTSPLSRQTSTTMKSKVGGEGQMGTAVGVSLTRATSSRKNTLREDSAEVVDSTAIDEESPTPVVSPSRPMSTTTGDVDRIDFRAYRNLRHEYRLRRQGSLTTQQNIPAAGESQEGPADEAQTRQRSLTAYARETLKAFGASFASSSNNHSVVTSHAGDNCYHTPDDIEYGRPGSGPWHMFKVRSRRQSESSTSTGPAHTSAGHGHGHANTPVPIRNRGYSVQYFSIEKPVAGEGSVASVEKIDRIKKFREMFQYLSKKAFSFLHQVWKTVVGHHLGISSGAVRQDDDIKELETEFQEIFLFHNPELYYFAIEFGLLVQYVYVALWATNFIFLADLSYHRVLWEFALVVPMVFNFFLLKQIIFTSVMLKSIVKLDQRIANEICERATDERVVTQRLKHLLRTNLKTMAIDRKEWYNHCYREYQSVLTEGQRGLDVNQLKRFLHALQIYLTDDSIRRIFQVLDTDKDQSVHWERLSQILLPEYYKRKIRLLKKKIVTSSRTSKHVEEDHEEDGESGKKKKNKHVKRASITYEYHIAESQESKNDGEVVGRKSSVLKAVTNLNPFNSHHTVISAGKSNENNSVSEKNGAVDSHANGISATRRHSFNIIPARGLAHASSEGTAGNIKRQTLSTDNHDGKGRNDEDSVSAPRQHSFNVFSKSTIGAGLAAMRGGRGGGSVKTSASTSTTPHNNRSSLPHITAAAKLFGVEDVVSSNSNSANNSARYSITGGREELRGVGTENVNHHHHHHSDRRLHSNTSSDNDERGDQSDARALARARRHSQHYIHAVEHNQLIDLIASKHASKHVKSRGDGDMELVEENGRENEDCDSNHSDGQDSHYSEASSSELSQFTDDRSIASDESDFSHTSQDIRYHDIYVEDQGMQDSDRSRVYSLRPPASPMSKSPSQTIRRGVSINTTKDLTKSNDVAPGYATKMHQIRIDTSLNSVDDHNVTDTQSAVMMSLEEEERQDGGGVVVFDSNLPTTSTNYYNQECRNDNSVAIHSHVNTTGKHGVKSRFVDV